MVRKESLAPHQLRVGTYLFLLAEDFLSYIRVFLLSPTKASIHDLVELRSFSSVTADRVFSPPSRLLPRLPSFLSLSEKGEISWVEQLSSWIRLSLISSCRGAPLRVPREKTDKFGCC